MNNLKLSIEFVEAIDNWYLHGLDPGGFAMSLLMEEHQEAYERAHELLKPHFYDHVAYIASLPKEGRGENVKHFKGGINLQARLALDSAVKGDDFDSTDDTVATAGIHLENHGNAIEIHAETLEKAQALRDEILALIGRNRKC